MKCGRDGELEVSSVDVPVNQLELEDSSVETAQTVGSTEHSRDSVLSDKPSKEQTNKQNEGTENLQTQKEKRNQSDDDLPEQEEENQSVKYLVAENNEDEDTQILVWDTPSEEVYKQSQSAGAPDAENEAETNSADTSEDENEEASNTSDEESEEKTNSEENVEENDTVSASEVDSSETDESVDASVDESDQENEDNQPAEASQEESDEESDSADTSSAESEEPPSFSPLDVSREDSEQTHQYGHSSRMGTLPNVKEYIQHLPTGVLSDDSDEDSEVLSPEADPEPNAPLAPHAGLEAQEEVAPFPPQILPFVSRYLNKSLFLMCRQVSRSWKVELDRLYENHTTTFPSFPLHFLSPETNFTETDFGFVINSSEKTARFLEDLGNHSGNPFPKRLVTILKSDEKDSEFWKSVITLLKRFGKQVYSLVFSWRAGGNEIEKCARLRNILQLLPNLRWLSIGRIPVKGLNQATFVDNPKLYNFLNKYRFPCLPSLEEVQFFPSANIPELLVECLLKTHPSLQRLFGEFRKCITFCQLPELKELDVCITDCDSILHGSPMDVTVNSPLKKVLLKKSGFSIFYYETVFKWLRRFASTLEDVKLVCKWMVYSAQDYDIVELPHVKRFQVKSLMVETLDYLRGLQSLEHLVVESYSPCDWSEEAESVLKFLTPEENPNIWQLLPNLITVRYEGKISRRSRKHTLNFHRDSFLEHLKKQPTVPVNVVVEQHEDGENTEEIDEEDLDTQLLFGEEVESVPKNAEKENKVGEEVQLMPNDAGKTVNSNEEEVDALPDKTDEKGNDLEEEVATRQNTAEKTVIGIEVKVVEAEEVETTPKSGDKKGNKIDEVENATDQKGNESKVKVETMQSSAGATVIEKKVYVVKENAEETGSGSENKVATMSKNSEEMLNEIEKEEALPNNEGGIENEIKEQTVALSKIADENEDEIEEQTTAIPKHVEEAESKEQKKVECEHSKLASHQVITPASH